MVKVTDALPGTPYSSTFVFEIDGTEIGRFSEVSGLEVNVEVYEHDEGGVNGFVHRLPGRVRWPTIKLRGGLTKGDALFNWFKDTTGEGFEGKGRKLERRTGAIALLDREGNRVRSWSFEGAFPLGWKGPNFSTESGQALIEELEISHNGFVPGDH
jgi:phage tail-like protein